MPNDPVVHRLVPFQRLGMAVLHFLALQRSTITQAEAERTLALFGPPGVGKTEGALAATLREGIAVMSISASMFASEVEGGAVQILEALLAEMERWSREHGIDIVLMLDDLDLSILAQDETQDIGATINTQLLLNRFHKLAEERHLYRTVSGGPIPFIVTMNDPTVLRASLLREGRCMMFEHVPTTAEKIDIAYAVLNPRTASERELVAALVKKFAAKQSVAFWKSLRSRVIAHTHKKLLQDGLP
ncbi:MAG: AAA family ATPase, partial [Hyphomicrobiaceae bacterium]|nr:AAA family ATPase [Hyphomicrobiaceae bacterium]